MMKKIVSFVLAALMLVPLCACSHSINSKTYDPHKEITRWVETAIKKNALMSFVYDGTPYTEHIKSWAKEILQTENGWKVTYQKDDLTVWSDIVVDTDHASVEWVNYFKNEGQSDSLVISNICAADCTVTVADPILTTTTGSGSTQPDEFSPYSVDLIQTPQYTFKNYGGRSSQHAFPYFDICNGDYGIMGAVGWTGDWKISIHNEKGQVSLKAGMQSTKIALYPDEQMRTPSFVLQFFKGDQDAGHNAFRQLILTSYTPSGLTQLPVSQNVWGGAGETQLLSLIEKRKQQGIDFEVLWVDAGWFGDYENKNVFDGIWSQQVGNWYYNPSYPETGFSNISRVLHEENKGLLLWLEPERAREGSKLYQEHPEYFFPSSRLVNFQLYNMGDRQARDYMLDLVSEILIESGVDWYRQDFNCDPSAHWMMADGREGDNRIGINEIRYITGLYEYLDALRERIPGLNIDNCASGGRRLDIEMMKRSVPLWRTDYSPTDDKSSNCDGVRTIGCNLSWWLPLNAGGQADDGVDTAYKFRCLYSPGMTWWSANDADWYKEQYSQYQECRKMMIGDYYILSIGQGENYNRDNCVYEYYLADAGQGYVMAFCPKLSSDRNPSYTLKGLDAQATYQVTNTDTGESVSLTGEELMTQGLSLTFPEGDQSFLIRFEKK